MLFRYKITKSHDWIGSIYRVRYNTQIQKYNANGILFKWKTCKDTSLKSIVELLSSEYCFSGFDNALQEIADTISKYGSIDEMIYEYIKRFVIIDMQLENKLNNIEYELDDIVLTNNWKTIEIKEND